MLITSGQVRYTCGVTRTDKCQHRLQKTRISCVNCQTTHTFIFRSMTIRLYLTISFYSLNSRGSSVSFQSVAAFLLALYPFHSPPPPCLYKMSRKSKLCVQYQYHYQPQHHGTTGTKCRRTYSSPSHACQTFPSHIKIATAVIYLKYTFSPIPLQYLNTLTQLETDCDFRWPQR